MRAESKTICGITHYRVRCSLCGELVWTQLAAIGAHRYRCDTCEKAKHAGVGRERGDDENEDEDGP